MILRDPPYSLIEIRIFSHQGEDGAVNLNLGLGLGQSKHEPASPIAIPSCTIDKSKYNVPSKRVHLQILPNLFVLYPLLAQLFEVTSIWTLKLYIGFRLHGRSI